MTTPERLAAALADRYRIERELGAGGMATVYLAEDLKHKRKVALKVLKPELAAVLGAERFVQEITTTAALQHPHILPLFDSGEADGFLYYVMPFIDGETLRAKLDRETQLSIDEAVRITVDVASALHYAHEHGVIHRDIKPENILLHEGRPMVADFGIALALSAAAGGRMTETGLSLGTPHYMSPEQATAAKEITARSDVYSLGSVLYEMLAGDPPHTGATAQAIIMKIIAESADAVVQHRKSVPPHVAAAVACAIQKVPADRFATAKAFADALRNPAFTTAMYGDGAGGGRATGGWRDRAAVPLAVLAGVLLIFVAAGALRSDPEPLTARYDLSFGGMEPDRGSDVAVSPDGSMLAVSGTIGTEQAIYLRRIGEPDFQKVLGTDRGVRPSFSPDSKWIVFRQRPFGSLVKVSVTGGQAMTLVRGEDLVVFDAHWGTDDEIVVSTLQGVYTVPAGGGSPERHAKAGGRTQFLLPDGSGILHSADGNVSFLDFATDSSTVLIPGARHGTYVESGHLLYVAEDGGLFAVPFDLSRHRVTGSAVRVLDRVAATNSVRGFSVSRNGVLVHHEGPAGVDSVDGRSLLVAMEFTGRADTLRLPSGRIFAPRFSPDGRHVAYEYGDPGAALTDIYTYDLVTGTNTQITFDRDNDFDRPLWSPDGKRILFTKDSGEAREDLFFKPVDNSAPEELVLSLPGNQRANAWLDDGTIVFESGLTSRDLFTYSLTDKGEPRAYLQAPWDERALVVSPDGTLAAFVSNESGQEVWMRSWPVAEGKWRVSFGNGAAAPRWSADGRYVYYWRLARPVDTLYRVQIDRSPSLVVRAAEPLLAFDFTPTGDWDLHPDGRRFIVSTGATAPSLTSASESSAADASRQLVVLNWFTELKALMAQQVGR